MNLYQRNQRSASPAEDSFSRLPRMTQSAYIARAQALGIDYISLFSAEQEYLLDNATPPLICYEQNLDNCTGSMQNALTEEESAMAKIIKRNEKK